jgi:hypothetical protein
LLEVLTEVAVLISLFFGGRQNASAVQHGALAHTHAVSNRVHGAHGGPWWRALPYWVLGLPLGAGILLGAIVAPTDPVLATDVQGSAPR